MFLGAFSRMHRQKIHFTMTVLLHTDRDVSVLSDWMSSWSRMLGLSFCWSSFYGWLRWICFSSVRAYIEGEKSLWQWPIYGVHGDESVSDSVKHENGGVFFPFFCVCFCFVVVCFCLSYALTYDSVCLLWGDSVQLTWRYNPVVNWLIFTCFALDTWTPPHQRIVEQHWSSKQTTLTGFIGCCSHKTRPRTHAHTHTHTLSLIHIWRCRRLLRCRSRWSPYH